MDVVFISNYLNHYQISFSNEMYNLLNGSYYFIQTSELDEERKKLGWKEETGYPYFLESYKEPDKCQKLIDSADIVVTGAADEAFIKKRRQNNKVIFRYSERIYKKGVWRVISPRGFYHMNKAHWQKKEGRMYMLCASAYTAGDLSMLGFYKNKAYKWGYFPEFKKYDLNDLMEGKRKNDKCELIWCARYLDWKHPELVLETAGRLRGEGISFHITMMGVGELRERCESYVEEKGLGKDVSFVGPLEPEEVRSYMEKANIFLFTSDYQEGWGVVLNEAMNSGCAVLASHAAGATPYLIRNGKNGLIYRHGDENMYNLLLDKLVKDSGFQERLGRAAYKTIEREWNPKVAAENLCALSKAILNDDEYVCKSGPCSRAVPVKQWNMWRAVKKTAEKHCF